MSVSADQDLLAEGQGGGMDSWAAAMRAAWEKRQAERRARLRDRQERAWEAAHAAARVLASEFGVSRVWLFGSLARGRGFHWRSDVDLAVEGLDERDCLKAMARCLRIDPSISVDVVPVESMDEGMLELVKAERIELFARGDAGDDRREQASGYSCQA